MGIKEIIKQTDLYLIFSDWQGNWGFCTVLICIFLFIGIAEGIAFGYRGILIPCLVFVASFFIDFLLALLRR